MSTQPTRSQAQTPAAAAEPSMSSAQAARWEAMKAQEALRIAQEEHQLPDERLRQMRLAAHEAVLKAERLELVEKFEAAKMWTRDRIAKLELCHEEGCLLLGESLSGVDQVSAMGRMLGVPYNEVASELLDRISSFKLIQGVEKKHRRKRGGWRPDQKLPMEPFIPPDGVKVGGTTNDKAVDDQAYKG